MVNSIFVKFQQHCVAILTDAITVVITYLQQGRIQRLKKGGGGAYI